MPIRNKRVKLETSLDKIKPSNRYGRLKSVERTARGRAKDMQNASLVLLPSVRQQRREKLPAKAETAPVTGCFVSVISSIGKPLMPCHAARARQLVKRGKALRKFKAGIFYIQLKDREDGEVQNIVCGIDPGSKREAFSVKSEHHTYLNVLSDAVDWVKNAVEVRRNMRRARRFRNMPCRKNRSNRSKSPFPPSTKARWQAKLRIINILKKLYPITTYVVEDIAARTKKGSKKWNTSFSPLEVGKKWFYEELKKIGNVETKQGYETKKLRDEAGLVKTKGKMDIKFSVHNIDSWILANWYIGGHIKPDNTNLIHLSPIKFHRRQLHRFQPKEGKRKRYGGTMSLGIKKGSLVKHNKYGITYVGGNMGNKISLHSINGDRICQNAKVEDIKYLAYNKWRIAVPLTAKAVGLPA